MVAMEFDVDDEEAPVFRTAPPVVASKTNELAKVRHFRKIMSEIAMDILMNPHLLNLFGIEGIEAYTPGQYTFKGLPCYPDLDLPSHPYYPDDEYAMPPAFYMWDMYQDGNAAVTDSVLKELYKTTEKAITGPYEMMKKMQKDGIQPPFGPLADGDMGLTPTTGGSAGAPQIQGRKLVWHPEGSDQVDFMLNETTSTSSSSSSSSSGSRNPPSRGSDDQEEEPDVNPSGFAGEDDELTDDSEDWDSDGDGIPDSIDSDFIGSEQPGTEDTSSSVPAALRRR